MKVYKLTVLVVDHDELGADGVREALAWAHFPNDCLRPHVMAIEERDIGPWRDEHPLNYKRTQAEEFDRIFSEEP